MATIAELQAARISRKKEISDYQYQKDTQAAILAALPDDLPIEWPAEIAQFRTAPRDVVAASCPANQLQLVIDLRQRDESQQIITQIDMELARCNRILAATESQLTEEQKVPPLDRLELGLAHLLAAVAAGTYTDFAIDEDTIENFTTVGKASVVVTLPNTQKKRLVLFVNDVGKVTAIPSSKPL